MVDFGFQIKKDEKGPPVDKRDLIFNDLEF